MSPEELRKLAEEIVQGCADLDQSDEDYWIGVQNTEAALRRVQKETARECVEICDETETRSPHADAIRSRFSFSFSLEDSDAQ